jgi:hypothetical protein
MRRVVLQAAARKEGFVNEINLLHLDRAGPDRSRRRQIDYFIRVPSVIQTGSEPFEDSMTKLPWVVVCIDAKDLHIRSPEAVISRRLLEQSDRIARRLSASDILLFYGRYRKDHKELVSLSRSLSRPDSTQAASTSGLP